MKKTLISVLLIVSLLSTALFSVVFAAYSVEKTATATAVVSAYGINLAINNVSTTETMKMMPGGSGKLADVDASGTANVKSVATYTLDVDDETFTEAAWTVDGSFYCPIVITIGTASTSGLNDDNSAKTYAEFVEDIQALEYTANIALNTKMDTDQADATTYDQTVTWAWDADSDTTKDNKLTSAAVIAIVVNAEIAQDMT